MSDTPTPIRVLSVDDHPLLREGVASLIGKSRDVVVAGEAASGREAIAQFRALRPDVTLMDLQMPDMGGIDAMLAIRAEFPQARFIVLTSHAGGVLAARAAKAGARAFVLKDAARKDLLPTIRTVHGGGDAMRGASAAPSATLTSREREVLELTASGHANRVIAQRLDISEETVKTHHDNVRLKLGAKDRAHAVALGHELGLLE